MPAVRGGPAHKNSLRSSGKSAGKRRPCFFEVKGGRLQPLAALGQQHGGQRGQQPKPQHNDKAEGAVLEGHRHVGAPQAEHDGGHRQNDGDGGQQLHHDVQVVGNHAGKRIHGARENVPVDVAHLNGLLVLDDHVLQKVRVLGVIPHKVHAQQLFQHDLVALQAGGEVHQALFQPQHLNQLFVLHGFVQLILHLVGGLVDLAQQCHMSETHFRRIFQEKMNMTPIEYVNFVRVKKACELIDKTDISMEEVAEKVGFITQSTFNRNFRKIIGTSPYQWKKRPDNHEGKLQEYRISALKGW